jgi:phosphoglycolate phosphatase-like HAD superfamily hydrolase
VTRVLLFDIDNTLLYSGGAGSLAMTQVFREMFGIDDGFAGIEFSGRTDRFILKAALDTNAIEDEFEGCLEAFVDGYYALLPRILAEKQGTLMPGFPELLAALSRTEGVKLGLATGNFSGGARHKLTHYGIEDFFLNGVGLIGGFGEESLDRADVVKVAISSIGAKAALEDVLVIGDTPKDIASALDNGVVAVGVATGSYGVNELRDSGAHLVFEDFSDWERAAGVLSGLAQAGPAGSPA